VARLGTATPPLRPGTDYMLSVHVVANNGTAADWATTFTTPKAAVTMSDPQVQSLGGVAARVSFSTDVCAAALFQYRSADGTHSGEWRGTGWPSAQPCFTGHEALLGIWNLEPLRPKTTYTLVITVATPTGDKTSWTGTFTT
jgi:hypothetical protein